MKSDGNSFCGDVVLDSFNKASRDEDNTLDQEYKSKYVRIFIMMILILFNIIRKCVLTQQYHLNPIFELLVVMGCISFNMVFPQSLLKLKFHNKDPKIFFFFFWSKILSLSRNALFKHYETTYPEKLFPSDFIILSMIVSIE